MLGINNFDALLGHPVVGMSWENYIIENIASVLPTSAAIYFYRTAAGAEVDLLIEFSSGKRWMIEIKKGLVPQVSRGFYYAIEDIKPGKVFIIYSGNENYSIANNIEVKSLFAIMNLLQNEQNSQ